ncbi:MAG: TetR family transcriptional regulator C-terminal domain-containing protein [Burkholderiales bacterium]|nr:TetR family transcriptional regulator C-terminal domain-containing protein [Burkholderiales bacterium]
MSAGKAREARDRKQIDIRRAAIEEFARHGYRGASTQAIAARAGLSKPQLHYYIDSKEDLYREVLLETMHAWGDLFAVDDAGLSPAQVLSDYIRRKLEFSFDHPLMSRIFTAEMLAGAPVFKPYMAVYRRRTAAAATMIRRWIDRGLMRPVDPLQLLMNIWAVTQSYADHRDQVLFYMRKPALGIADRERIIAHVTSLILTGCGLGAAPVAAAARRRPARRPAKSASP